MNPSEIFIRSNQGYILDDFSSFWIVVSDEVDVYYISQKNKEIPQRHYLYTARKGSILFGFKKTGTSNQTYQLLAASPNAKLIKVSKSDIFRLESESLTSKIDEWLIDFSGALYTTAVPRIYEDISSENKASFKKGKVLYPSKGIKWILQKSGGLEIFGSQAINSEAEDVKNVLLPCSNILWTKITSKKVKVSFHSTREFIEDDIQLMLSLHYVVDQFQIQLENLDTIRKRLLDQKFEQKWNKDAELLSSSLQNIKDIVKPDSRDTNIQSFTTGDNILTICNIIGEKDGFEFIAPKFISDYENNITGKLESICRTSKVRLRKVILRGEWWKEQNGNLLAFDKDSKEPIALIQNDVKGYNAQTVEMRVPGDVDSDLLNRLDAVAYMFLYAFDKPMSKISELWNFGIRGLKKDAFFILLAAFSGSLLALLTPILSGVLFDDVIPNADRPFLLEIVLIMCVIGVVKCLLQLIRGVFILRVETKSNINIQAGLMDHLLRLPVTFFRSYTAGDLTQRVLGVNGIRSILSNTVLTAVLSGTFSIVNLILIFYYSSKLAWFAILLSLIAVVVVSTLGFLKLRYDRQLSHRDGDLQGFLFEVLSGISKVRITGTEKRFFALWADKFRGLKWLSFKSGNIQNFVEAFNSSYPLLTYIVFFILIYNMTSSGATPNAISVGVFMAFISAFNQFLNDCLTMSISLISSLNMIPLYERLKPILDEVPESTEEAIDPGELAGEIELNNVDFRYGEDQPLVLKDVSLKIKPGEMVAFVGPSGSGKSTVLRLLLGFDKPEKGIVSYDGQDYSSLNKDLVRRQIGVVLQNGSLMPGSIYKNIVGNSELTLSDAEEAAKMSGLEEDIAQMPMGMHTVVSDGASTFSGGQKQRLMIARSIAHKPRLLYMDEATSALDNHTQKMVSESLDRLQATRIIIAHRLSTIMNADRIIVMDQGRIEETGTYQELIQKGGLFSRLAQRQIA